MNNSHKCPLLFLLVVALVSLCVWMLRYSEFGFDVKDAKSVNKDPEGGQMEILIKKAENGDGVSIRRLFALDDVLDDMPKFRKLMPENRLLNLLELSAERNDSKSQYLLFEYCYAHPNYRPENWKLLLRRSFEGGEVEAGFLLVILSKYYPDFEYRFDDLDLKKSIELMGRRVPSEIDEMNMFENDLNVADFEKIFKSNKEEIEILLNGVRSGAEVGMSSRAGEILNMFNRMKK